MTREAETLPCDGLRALVDKIGAPAAADKIGVSHSVIYKALKDNKVRSAFEYAARYHLGKAYSPAYALVKVPADKAEAFNTVMAALGLELAKVTK